MHKFNAEWVYPFICYTLIMLMKNKFTDLEICSIMNNGLKLVVVSCHNQTNISVITVCVIITTAMKLGVMFWLCLFVCL